MFNSLKVSSKDQQIGLCLHVKVENLQCKKKGWKHVQRNEIHLENKAANQPM